ncbi:hypothetical protein TWF694_002922 [Orbilia ellipsospora]|uniref:F-box domain-containing protein n=1 Tax=Orbilia ellipsospora TaxID=2528407 RepID=A0AAV9X1C3_9PEZI
MANLPDHLTDPSSVAEKPAKAKLSLLSCPSDVLLGTMKHLNLQDLAAFASTSKLIRNVYKSHALQVVNSSLGQSIRNPELYNWFPYPVPPEKAKAPNDVVTEISANTDKAATEAPLQPPSPVSSLGQSEHGLEIELHVYFLRHANRLVNILPAVKFFANWLHRIEGHDGNGNHNCFTEYKTNRICNETFRVLVFLAQNEVYEIARCVGHCLFEERIFPQCDPGLFDKIKLPLPENWWIKKTYSGERSTFLAATGNGESRDSMQKRYTERELMVHEDECFQKRRMAVAKLLARAINITPARKIPDYELNGQRFWYDKGIVAGLIFMQIAPLTWCHDSMIAMIWRPEDLALSSFAYLGPQALRYFRDAAKIAETLMIKC